MTRESPACGADPESTRRRNLATILGLVHRRSSLSRAELTRSTGLNRSTTGALVTELVRLGFVVEASADASGARGRPSPTVRPDPRNVAITLNPEVDAITAAVVQLGGVVVSRVRQPSEGNAAVEHVVASSAHLVRRLSEELPAGSRVIGIGAAIPGLVRAEDGLVRLAPHLGWHEVEFTEQVAAKTGLPVLAANDASLGCRAEHIFGAGQNTAHTFYVNGGASGIGGGMIVGGVPVHGNDGYAGEIGHTLVAPGGVACHCGAVGCLETEVRRDRLLDVLELADADDDELDEALASTTAPRVAREVERQLDVLGVALSNAVNLLNPSLIVLGGFVAALHTAGHGVLERAISGSALAAPRESVKIVPAALGANRLHIGAAELVFDRLLRDPGAVFDPGRSGG